MLWCCASIAIQVPSSSALRETQTCPVRLIVCVPSHGFCVATSVMQASKLVVVVCVVCFVYTYQVANPCQNELLIIQHVSI